LRLTNFHNLPDIVVDALSTNHYSRGASDISVTSLIDAPKVNILQERHDDEMERDISENVFSTFGAAFHHLLDLRTGNERENVISEERIFAESNGWTISGAIDLQEIEDGEVVISDYKVTSAWSVIFGKKEWENQLNCYAGLVRMAKKMPVKELRIIAILRDWQRRKAQTEDTYPQSPITVVNIPMWSEQEAFDYLDSRVKLHQSASFEAQTNGVLPQCSPQERWQKDTTYAVMKKNRVRAIKIHTVEEEAESHASSLGKDHFIQERLGDATRCSQNWCGVAKWCDQYQKEGEEGC
tara:strand:- start:443 stop:1330 length:888 start_codon:yes stop_codon:yes gene_type:complete